MEAKGFWERGGAWVIGQNVLTLVVGILSPLTSVGALPGMCRWIGAAFMAISAVYGVAGVVALGKNRTVFPTPKAHAELVQIGIYRFVRHPLYASVGFLVIGWALFWRSVAGAILSAALVLVLREKARREEKWLCNRFPEYESYRTRVKSVIPGLI